MARYWWLDRSEWPKVNGAALTGQHGKHPRGTDHYAARLTEADVIDIRAGKYGTVKAAADALGVHYMTAYAAYRGTTWARI